jgi:predicted secreted Zn-dependent protease
VRALILSPLCPVGLIVFWAGCASSPRNGAFDTYPASVTGHTTIVYYDVQGRTFDELSSGMHRLGPRVAGTSVVGETRSPIRWNWRLESTGASLCSIREVTVSVNAEVTLPRWNPPPDAEPGLVAEWKRFLFALEMHEAGHKDISAKAGRDIVNSLRGMTGLCSEINSRANDVARAIVDNASEEQRAYDVATRHGLTQGTSFRSPPPRQ